MDQHQSQRRLSEISHLFLSDVRAKATGNAPRPVRTPPGGFKGDVSIDLTPEEFAQVFGGQDDEPAARSDAAHTDPACTEGARFKPVRAVIAHHLGELMADRLRDFAGMLCTDGQRVGVIYADASDVRVVCIEHNPHAERPEEEPAPESLEPQRLEETLVELNNDVDHWIIVLPDARCGESRDLLRQIPAWTLISGVDHDTVVSSYRTIKGLCEVARPKLSIAIYGAVDEAELDKTYRKLGSVCEQFLHMNAELIGAIEPGDELAEHVVLTATASHNKAQFAAAPQWKILADMVRGSAAAPAIEMPKPAAAPALKRAQPPVEIPQEPAMRIEPPKPASLSASLPVMAEVPGDDYTHIIDLPHADASPAAIISAVVRGGADMIESPVKAPSHPDAVVAVSRDHRLTLLAVARQGLSDLRSIAQAFRWMNENRALIAMAIPQFSIDTHQAGRLELLVDQADMTADVLQPLLASGQVAVRAYRKLRWGAKTGLLLEAA